MNLKDFRPDNLNFDDEEELPKHTGGQIPASTHHEEINTLKIEKLSNRVTIISIIIPCLISAIIIFAYLDMKERVVDVDQTKQNQVDKISQQLEERLNALDIKIARNRYDLDNKLPELNNKTVSIEGSIAKLVSGKADNKTIQNQFIKLEKRVSNNANQDKMTLQTLERVNKENLSAITKNQDLFDKAARQIKEEIALFKEKFDAELLKLSDSEQQIDELRMNLSLLDKKYKRLDRETISQAQLDKKLIQLKTDLNTHMKKTDEQVNTLNRELISNIARIQKSLDLLPSSFSPQNPTKKTQTHIKPKQPINIDSSGFMKIEEESLTQ
ncbi:coiled-coil domain-containing protein [Desulfobacula toluolica]|nr:hypothetical protein [Desulfobacula toluolica]